MKKIANITLGQTEKLDGMGERGGGLTLRQVFIFKQSHTKAHSRVNETISVIIPGAEAHAMLFVSDFPELQYKRESEKETLVTSSQSL